VTFQRNSWAYRYRERRLTSSNLRVSFVEDDALLGALVNEVHPVEGRIGILDGFDTRVQVLTALDSRLHAPNKGGISLVARDLYIH